MQLTASTMARSMASCVMLRMKPPSNFRKSAGRQEGAGRHDRAVLVPQAQQHLSEVAVRCGWSDRDDRLVVELEPALLHRGQDPAGPVRVTLLAGQLAVVGPVDVHPVAAPVL